jgi:pseudouridine synthase, RluA family
VDTNNEERLSLIVAVGDGGRRLDAWLGEQEGVSSRSQAGNWIADGRVQRNGKVAKSSEKVQDGDQIEVCVPSMASSELMPEDIPLDIVYQDKDIAVINKGKGMVVHPSAGHPGGTLVNALLFHIPDLAGIGGELRPGIVHRIDKDTTGLIVVAKHQEAMASLSEQIKQKEAERLYYALVESNIREDEGTVAQPIGRSPRDRKKMAARMDGRPAVTHFRVLERFGEYSFVECQLETGRTHQIRVHMAYIHHPVAGDEAYGRLLPRLGLTSQALHAHKLSFRHPSTGQWVSFEAPMPPEMQRALELLRKKNGRDQ